MRIKTLLGGEATGLVFGDILAVGQIAPRDDRRWMYLANDEPRRNGIFMFLRTGQPVTFSHLMLEDAFLIVEPAGRPISWVDELKSMSKKVAP